MDKLRNMALLCRVVEHEQGNFAKAAHSLNLTPAMVGRHIASLEKMLGLSLILRTTRSMEVTTADKKYYSECKRILERIYALEHSLSQSVSGKPEGLIRIGTPDGFAAPYLLNLIAAFQQRYPKGSNQSS